MLLEPNLFIMNVHLAISIQTFLSWYKILEFYRNFFTCSLSKKKVEYTGEVLLSQFMMQKLSLKDDK